MRRSGTQGMGRLHLRVRGFGGLGTVLACVRIAVHVWGIECTGANGLAGGEDRLCGTLFEEYVVSAAWVRDSDLEAVCQIIASRGRESGFWTRVLAELRKGNKKTEMASVKILGKMLEADAYARDALEVQREKPDEIGAFVTYYLGDEVIDELIARASSGDCSHLREYVVAMARSGSQAGKGLFLDVLQSRGSATYGGTEEFYAAVGLSQLGDPVGVTWLIDHCEDRVGSVFSVWPEGTLSRNVDACSQAALKAISGRDGLRKASEWQNWWNSVKENFKPARRVRIVSVL